VTEDNGNGESDEIQDFREKLEQVDGNDDPQEVDADNTENPKYLIQELQARLESRDKRLKILERDIGRAAKRVKQLEDENKSLKQKTDQSGKSSEEVEKKLQEQEKELRKEFEEEKQQLEEELNEQFEEQREELIQTIQKKAAQQVRRDTAKEVTQLFFEVRDNLVRALDQGEDADIRPGVKATLSKFDNVLNIQGIKVINPEDGTKVDPQRHEVVGREESTYPEGTIVAVYRQGYVSRGDNIIRTAQVAVSNGTPPEEENNEIPDTEPSEPPEQNGGDTNTSENTEQDLDKIADELSDELDPEDLDLDLD